MATFREWKKLTPEERIADFRAGIDKQKALTQAVIDDPKTSPMLRARLLRMLESYDRRRALGEKLYRDGRL